MEKSRTSLVIPTINRLDLLKHTVSLFQVDEVVIVDNGSTPEVAEWAIKSGFVLVRYPYNTYVTHAWNAGV